MAEELARVLDPTELDALTGPHGKMSITLTAADEERETVFVIPRRVTCARCDGGGCDSCGRSGAIRLDLSEDERTTHFMFPATREDVRVRLARPVAGLDLLTVEIRVTQSSALQLRSTDAVVRRPSGSALDLRSIVIAIGLALAAALAFAVSR